MAPRPRRKLAFALTDTCIYIYINIRATILSDKDVTLCSIMVLLVGAITHHIGTNSFRLSRNKSVVSCSSCKNQRKKNTYYFILNFTIMMKHEWWNIDSFSFDAAEENRMQQRTRRMRKKCRMRDFFSHMRNYFSGIARYVTIDFQ